MRCHICDATLSAEQIQWNRDHEDWDPCGTCLEVINNVFEHASEEEIDYQLSMELEEFEEFTQDDPEVLAKGS